jgi:hypothetical protein
MKVNRRIDCLRVSVDATSNRMIVVQKQIHGDENNNENIHHFFVSID